MSGAIEELRGGAWSPPTALPNPSPQGGERLLYFFFSLSSDLCGSHLLRTLHFPSPPSLATSVSRQAPAERPPPPSRWPCPPQKKTLMGFASLQGWGRPRGDQSQLLLVFPWWRGVILTASPSSSTQWWAGLRQDPCGKEALIGSQPRRGRERILQEHFHRDSAGSPAPSLPPALHNANGNNI